MPKAICRAFVGFRKLTKQHSVREHGGDDARASLRRFKIKDQKEGPQTLSPKKYGNCPNIAQCSRCVNDDAAAASQNGRL